MASAARPRTSPHLGARRPKVRLECVVGSDHASTIVETVLKHAGDRRFVFVVGVDEAYPADAVKVDAIAGAAG